MASLHNISLIFFLLTATYSIATPVPPTKNTNNNHAQFVHEKEDSKPEANNNDDNDQFHLTNDYKPDPPQPAFPTWNPYAMNDQSAAARFLGLFGYPSPYIVPYPVFLPQDSMYPYQPYQDYDDYEDAMGRGGSRRGSGYRNSPVYYIRLPPTPYMFIPGIGYHSQPPTFTPSFQPSFSPLLPYNPIQALPVQPAINPFINLPLNFISNGKPTGIYQLDSNHLPSHPYQQYVPPPPPPTRPYRPAYTQPQQNYIPQDSKISALKRPFLFNGRPEQIYVLQSSFNPMYQSPIPGYY